MIKSAIRASIAVKNDLLADENALAGIDRMATACLHAIRSGGKVILCGNGGSFGDAQHISAEFTSRFMFDRDPLASIALGCNSSSMSAIGNDYGYDFVFARELTAVGGPNDVLIAISTSGNSPNVLNAIRVANEKQIPTIGLTGLNGGAMKALCSCIQVPSNETARIQECHILIGHVVCEIVEHAIFKKEAIVSKSQVNPSQII